MQEKQKENSQDQGGAMGYHKRYYQANRERIAAQQREYRRANPEKMAAQRRAYYQANRERIAAQQKKYRREKRKTACEKNTGGKAGGDSIG